MSSHVVAPWWFGAVVAVLFALLMVLLEAHRRLGSRPATAQKVAKVGAVMMLALLSVLVLVLSGCGTAPLLAPIRLQVPAELLTPPAPPVLLTPGSALPPPGPTTPPTPKAARPTGSGTSV